jgi:Ca2+-binding EF-hand superfamily protein
VDAGHASEIPGEFIEAALAHINVNQTATTSEMFYDFALKVGSIGAAMAERWLQLIVTHLNVHNTTAGDLFASLDSDGSGELDEQELQRAMKALGITMSAAAVTNIMRALDSDGDSNITMIEMAEIIDKFRRSRREFASTALSFILEAVNSKKYSIHRLFQRYDKDGSGSLNKTEFQEAMLQIGLKLDEFQVDQILAEIDFDISGSIEANEL